MSEIWSKLHKNYAGQDWKDKPSLFAETAITHFPTTGRVLELGAGLGQDSRHFAEHGYDVTCTDLVLGPAQNNLAQLPDELQAKITFQALDLREALPFPAASYDVVYAHLSLHYFDTPTTERIFRDMYTVLKPGGILAFFTNSTSDPEYRTGIAIEPDYFQVGGATKRYLSAETARGFAKDFEVLLCDTDGETYKDSAKGVHNLIRFIGRRA